MNALTQLNPIIAQALAPHLAPRKPAGIAIDRLREEVEKLHAERVSLLRLPFQVEVQTKTAITNRAPEDCSEAEYSYRTIDDDLVAQAADWLIDRHMDELERKALELQGMRDNGGEL